MFGMDVSAIVGDVLRALGVSVTNSELNEYV